MTDTTEPTGTTEASTIEALDALPIGSVVLDAHGDCFQRIEDTEGRGAVIWSGNYLYASSRYLALPAQVLHVGGTK